MLDSLDRIDRTLRRLDKWLPPEKPKGDRPTIELSLTEFFRESWHVIEPATELSWNWHLEAICIHAESVFMDWLERRSNPSYQQRIQNLLINVPPGSSKSRIISVCLPSWIWTLFPAFKMLFLSANPRVALRDAVFCRDLIESPWYQETFQPSWKLRSDQNSKSSFWNTAGGMRSAFGMLSKVTGDRGDCLIVDDPNDVDEVKSEVKRRAVNERWSDAIENRVSNLQTSFRIGIMQRCHTEDWSGHVLKSGNWEHLCIPQEFEEPRSPTAIGWLDPRTEPGELLDPKRSPAEVIAKEKAKGAYYYAGQHQQRPVPKEGGVIQGAWIRKRDRLPDRIDRWILSVDAKFKKTKSGSFAVVQAWAQSGADLFIFDQWRERLGFVQTKNAILTMRERWGSELGSESATLIEDKASGPAIIDELSSIPGIIPIQTDGSKEARLEATSGYYESGNVYVVEETWSKSEHSTPQIWIDELTSFPFASTDDQCDGASQAIRYLQRKPLSYTSAFTSQES